MKKIFLFVLSFAVFSCGSMESDADKYCELVKESMELSSESMKIALQPNSGKKVKDLASKAEDIRSEIKEIDEKYEDDKKFEEYLKENCDAIDSLLDLDMFKVN